MVVTIELLETFLPIYEVEGEKGFQRHLETEEKELQYTKS